MLVKCSSSQSLSRAYSILRTHYTMTAEVDGVNVASLIEAFQNERFIWDTTLSASEEEKVLYTNLYTSSR